MYMLLKLQKRKKYTTFLQGFFVVVLVVNMFSFTPPAHATAWGMVNVFSDLMMNAVERIQRQIEGAILGTLKVAAIEMLNNKVGQLIGGGSAGKALFITDWNAFLYKTPAQEAQLYMNDFFSLTTRGKASSANYIGISGESGRRISGNYSTLLVESAKANIAMKTAGADSPSLQYTLEEYGGIEAVKQGDMRAFNALISSPANNTFGYTLMAENAYDSYLAEQREIATTKAQSSGFLGAEKDGITQTPAGVVEAITTDVSTLGNKMITSATNPGEFLSGVVGAMVNKMVTRLVQTGVGAVQANIQREIRNVNKQTIQALNEASRNLGPAAQFSRELNQRTGGVNVQTPAPPAASPVNY